MKGTNTGFDAAQKALVNWLKQTYFAAAQALTTSGFTVKRKVPEKMQATFKGGATRYSQRAMAVIPATPASLVAVVHLREDGDKGTPHRKALGHLFTGGSRSWKRMEGAFRRLGVLPAGYGMAVPKTTSWANPLDSYGNANPRKIVQLLSYFRAFGEQGYKANMTDKRKRQLAKAGRTEAGYRSINGVVYFISRGRGQWVGRRAWRNGRTQHLPAGIWAKRGIHGSDVAPVFLFVRQPRYRRLIDLPQIGREVMADFPREFEKSLRKALATAR